MLKLCFNLTKDSAAQWYQYRILHKIIPVKIYLKKIKAANNDNYTLCGISTGSIEHNFISYSHSLAMWNHFNTHLYNTSSERIGFIIRNVIFGDCPLLNTNMVLIYFLLFQSNQTSGFIWFIMFPEKEIWKLKMYVFKKNSKLLMFDKR